MKESRLASGFLLCCVVISGCSSSSTTRETSTESVAKAAVSHSTILIDDRGLLVRGIDGVSETTIEADVQFGGQIWASPNRRHTALTVHRDGATHLGIVASDGTYRDVHNLAGESSYSVAWAPSGDSLLLGFNNADGHGILVYSSGTGDLTDVGCSASNVALSWGRGDWFVVGDKESHYVVERSGCGTIESIDSRKMHEVTFGPRGDRAAYVLRELEYDSNSREYRPDSSLYVASSVGTDPVLVAGDRYRPHRPEWSSDAMSLAFDAQLPDAPDRRLISIYDIEGGMSSFLNPKAVDSKSSEWAPHWSPSGDAIAYQHSSKRKPAVVTVRVLANSFSTTIGESGESFVGWLDDDRIILSGNDKTRIVGSDGKEMLVMEGTVSVIALGEPAAAGSN